MVQAVIFDLGNTLIKYYTREEFPEILKEAIENCTRILSDKGQLFVQKELIQERVKKHNHGSPGNKVYPLEQRLASIFELTDETMLRELCTAFMKPILKTSKLYDEVLPVLRELKRRNYTVAVLTNTPWGCPSNIWISELDRYDLTEYINTAVCCYDVGWRKPDPRPFKHLLNILNLEPKQCLFVGDDPRWDIEGPQALGMKTLLIDRTGLNPDAAHGLDEVLDVLAEDDFRE
ncbi:MAG: HAD family hydrolase [Candidatus Thorarchaeota archaeon]|nr:HAD family hydrolase [Candidatus Thorarchaeota archaeon]